MFDGFEKDEDKAIKIVNGLNNICQEWQEQKEILFAIKCQTNIEEIEKCDCVNEENIKIEDINKRMKCKKCFGTGYILKLKHSN